MKKIVVLISGQGLNLQAIIDACAGGFVPAQISAVISNKADAFGLQRAKSAGISTQVFLRRDYADNVAMDAAIGDYIQSLQADFIILAGYMKILTPAFIRRFEGRIVNVHPSLLPKYPGLDTYRRAMAAGETEHGTTVHFVNEEVDGGAVIVQAKVPIFPDDDVEDVEERVKAQEIQLYPLVIKWLAQDRLTCLDGRAYLDHQILPENGYATE
ncbi:phosphoribosylglycinamide formyltransferase [Caviibacterium pharyngocola]|uniref:Phosphoribosylglycinamide formyltransferase n=1 Tax=Caviibacterium pharyngocola TaxID=28159 RepID=A0A2M8RVM3_9PAST|nr:phosphoribosylglycinamide formyltransferase [Caviibacterium pharyngocola]PJG82937.1 phosphoribosylglycinamide formyltransferase [Caviibacterium pharyngocola]